MEIPKTLKDDIWDYCRLNDISNIDEFTLKLLKHGFTIEKFGATPVSNEKIVEKIVEVEKVVEKIIEVPVETIIEKVVEKEVFITNDNETKKLTDEITRLDTLNRIQTLNITNSDKQIVELTKELVNVKEQLEVEKLKKKKDFYGE